MKVLGAMYSRLLKTKNQHYTDGQYLEKIKIRDITILQVIKGHTNITVLCNIL